MKKKTKVSVRIISLKHRKKWDPQHMCGHTDKDMKVALPPEKTFRRLRQKERFPREGY